MRRQRLRALIGDNRGATAVEFALVIGPLLLVRFSISQMDVPTRQSYIMAVVSPEERSAAAGITGVARTTGAAINIRELLSVHFP